MTENQLVKLILLKPLLKYLFPRHSVYLILLLMIQSIQCV